MGAPQASPQGIVPALVTPFRQDERIDFTAWERIIDLLIANGADGLLVAGGQGEFFALSEEERVVSMRFCKQHVAGRAAVYANVGAVTTRESVRLARHAQAEGVDYAVVITPYYLRPSQNELVEHYTEICHAVSLPVLAYNIPERTGVDLETASIVRIARACPNFAGLKDSTGRLAEVPKLVALSAERPFSVFIGRDHMILPALKLGCAGAVTACANVAPRLFADLYRAFREGRQNDAEKLQALVNPLREAFGLGTFPSVVKEAMNLAGIPAGACRRPVGTMPAEARANLRAVLEQLRGENYLPSLAARAANP
jgi:4-hydroxy-tetrahydrodipicolinate synthase